MLVIKTSAIGICGVKKCFGVWSFVPGRRLGNGPGTETHDDCELWHTCGSCLCIDLLFKSSISSDLHRLLWSFGLSCTCLCDSLSARLFFAVASNAHHTHVGDPRAASPRPLSLLQTLPVSSVSTGKEKRALKQTARPQMESAMFLECFLKFP